MISDCAHVGETLAEYFPEGVNTGHILRSRNLLDKTAKIAWKILRARGDIFHCHYLLQDCWLALQFGKHPVLGHAHGSDLTESIHHLVWGRIVRHNLNECDKIVVSTPNLLETAKEFNESAEYVPNIVNREVFYPKNESPLSSDKTRLRVLIASACDWSIRGTDRVIKALSTIRKNMDVRMINYGVDLSRTLTLAKSLGVRVKLLPHVPHMEMPNYYWNADIVIASIGIGGTLGVTALEAIACGRPVIANVSSEFSAYDTFPIHDISTPERISNSILSFNETDLWRKEYKYFESYHNPQKIAERFVAIYEQLIGEMTSD
jgi:glycosyltransferase involved in cell wall biosynthesis